MTTRYFVMAAASLTLWSVSAQAEIEDAVQTLIADLDTILCDEYSVDEYGWCVEGFDGAFGSAADPKNQFKGPDKNRENRKRVCEYDPVFPHEIEAANCNSTDTKPEWRHDSLKLKLQSALVEYIKGRDDAGDVYMCTYLAESELMHSNGYISDDGYGILMQTAGPLVPYIACDTE